MSKLIATTLVLFAVLSTTTGFVLSRSVHTMNIKMNVKDLPESGLSLISPTHSSFNGRLTELLKGEPNDVLDNIKPFSIFLENKSQHAVVAYMLQWCFTKPDGTNDCFRKAVVNPVALMDGGGLPEQYDSQSSVIKPNSSRFFSIASLDGRGTFRFPVSHDEAEQIKQGKRFNKQESLRRHVSELAKYSEITVSIDGAFFDDGTFVGPDTTGFFAQTKAMIDAKSDLLNEMNLQLGKTNASREEVFSQVEATAKLPDINLNSKSTPTDYYNYYKKSYADEMLRVRQTLGDDKALTSALHPLRKPWPKLRKKQD
jgi:hypothetical protein